MGLLDNALQALKSQYEETKGNLGLLVSDPKRYMSGLNQDAAEYNRLSSLALQAERNAYRGIPVSQEQAAAKQYIDQQQQDMALGFTGSIKPGAGWMGKSAPNVEKLAKNKDKFLYHSDVAKNVNDLHYGIEPQQGGSWIKELAQGATDNPKALLESQTPMAWFSDKPEWVKMKVARELNKSVDKVTVEDIKNHGHLAIINKKDPYLTDIWRVGDKGLSEGEYSKVQNLKGEQVPAYQTNMYQEGNYGNRLEPFGVEKNEWVSTQSVEPFLQLTGDDLVRYLELTKNLDAKKIKAKK